MKHLMPLKQPVVLLLPLLAVVMWFLFGTHAWADASNSASASILVPRPPSVVWEMLQRPELLSEKEQKVKKVTVLSRGVNTQKLAYSTVISPLLPRFDYTVQFTYHAPDRVTFRRVAGSFKEMSGYWKMAPADNGHKTLLTYSVSIDPGFMAPKFLVLQAVKADLPTWLENVRLVIERQAPTTVEPRKQVL